MAEVTGIATNAITPASFIGLPIEIHQQIFDDYLAEPRNERYQDPLAILRVCRSVYNRLVGTVRDKWLRLICPSTSRSLFRDPLANGSPSLFQSDAPGSQCPIHTGISELEFVRLHRIHIVVRYRSDAKGVTTLAQNLHRTAVALKKSRTLRSVVLEIGPQFLDGFVLEDELQEIQPLQNDPSVWGLLDGLQSLLKACIAAKIKVTVQSSDYFDNTNQRWSNFRTIPFEDFPDCLVQELLKWMPLQAGFGAPTLDDSKREAVSHFLQPECRKCYAVFRSQKDLLRHLKKLPQHKIEFRVKKRNFISANAKPFGGRHTCIQCATPFDARTSLDRHLKRAHGRPRGLKQGIAPRWKEDNRRPFPVEQRVPEHETRWATEEAGEFEEGDLSPFDSAGEEEYPPGFW
jgi:uncharacterized C2H2 Zn-finger protein